MWGYKYNNKNIRFDEKTDLYIKDCIANNQYNCTLIPEDKNPYLNNIIILDLISKQMYHENNKYKTYDLILQYDFDKMSINLKPVCCVMENISYKITPYHRHIIKKNCSHLYDCHDRYCSEHNTLPRKFIGYTPKHNYKSHPIEKKIIHKC